MTVAGVGSTGLVLAKQPDVPAVWQQAADNLDRERAAPVLMPVENDDGYAVGRIGTAHPCEDVGQVPGVRIDASGEVLSRHLARVTLQIDRLPPPLTTGHAAGLRSRV